jgi:hypothetical protein
VGRPGEIDRPLPGRRRFAEGLTEGPLPGNGWAVTAAAGIAMFTEQHLLAGQRAGAAPAAGRRVHLRAGAASRLFDKRRLGDLMVRLVDDVAIIEG